MDKVIASNKIQITAPIEHVWNKLINFDQYPSWNPFTTKVTSSLKIGEMVTMNVKMTAKKNEISSKARLKKIEPPHLICWGTTIIAPFILNTERYQILEVVDANHTTYHTYEEMKGALSSFVLSKYGSDIKRGFNEMANALKKYAEL